MSKLLRCPDCCGRKNIIGMGLMGKPCKKCNAVGWVNRDEASPPKSGLELNPLIDDAAQAVISQSLKDNIAPRETNFIESKSDVPQGEFTSVQIPELGAFPARMKTNGRPKAKAKTKAR